MSFEKNVFINCPFDDSYLNNILKPIVFIVVKNGFHPCLSLNKSDSGESRLEKITVLMQHAKYSIHDLSLIKSKRKNEYARMNMPFELGIDYGLRKSGQTPFDEKKFLILGGEKYDYMKALSDINGFDIKIHEHNTITVIERMYAWFTETVDLRKQPPPGKIFDDYILFNTLLFNEKEVELGSEALAKNYMEHLKIPEYIDEIKERM